MKALSGNLEEKVSDRMVIVFFGPPGSGKGTQAQVLEKKINGLVHISTGELVRQEIASQTELGREIEAIVQAGKFPKDEVIIKLAADILTKNAKKDMVFDGFPRTLNQAIAFDTLLGVENLKVDVVFDFDIDVHVLIERISGRYFCRECGAVYHEKNKKPKIDGKCDQCGSSRFDKRADDTGDILKTRMKIYQEQTLPAKNYYRDKGVLRRIDASLPPSEVTKYINEALKEAGLMKEGE
jgi:adenylate kinase